MKSNYIVQLGDVAQPCIADLVELPGHASGRSVFLITRINVPEKVRGQGWGSNLLRMICSDANQEGVVLEVHPTPSGGLNMTQLLRWYRRYGFEGHAGVPMLRYPGCYIPRPRTPQERDLPSCVGCGDWGPGAQLEELRAGNPTLGTATVGYACLDCSERFRRIIIARYPNLTGKFETGMAAVNHPSRRFRTEGGVRRMLWACTNSKCANDKLEVSLADPLTMKLATGDMPSCGICGQGMRCIGPDSMKGVNDARPEAV